MTVSRRIFLGVAASAWAARAAGFAPQLLVFSKHFPDLNYDELGETAKQLGFDGVDLTVRPKGHVLPERAAEDFAPDGGDAAQTRFERADDYHRDYFGIGPGCESHAPWSPRRGTNSSRRDSRRRPILSIPNLVS